MNSVRLKKEMLKTFVTISQREQQLILGILKKKLKIAKARKEKVK